MIPDTPRPSRVTRRKDIEERTLAFAVRIAKLVNALPRSVAGVVIARQVMRAGTSI